MNFEQAKTNMIKQQLRCHHVLDAHILHAIENTPRETFVTPLYENLAYADMQLPISHGEVMMSPIQEALMLKYLQLNPSDTVLEVGTGTGYVTALLAKLSKHVTTVDIQKEFTLGAKSILSDQCIDNVSFATGDAALGWQQAYFDVIAITGSLPFIPKQFLNQMHENGRLFIIKGDGAYMQATLVKYQQQKITSEALFETNIKPLICDELPDRFVF